MLDKKIQKSWKKLKKGVAIFEFADIIIFVRWWNTKDKQLERDCKGWMGQRYPWKTWTLSRIIGVITHVNRKGTHRIIGRQIWANSADTLDFPWNERMLRLESLPICLFWWVSGRSILYHRWASLAKLRQRLFGWTIHLEGCADGYKNHEATTTPLTVWTR